MPEPNYCNLRGVVNNLITRQAKFGSFEASKAALDKKYGKPIGPDHGFQASHFAYYKNYDEIAGINYYMESNENNILVYNGVKEITTKTLNYVTEANGDKFVRMYGYDKKSNCCYSIIDSNKNGYVDNGDTVKLSQPECSPEGGNHYEGAIKYNTITKTIAEFLGLN